MLARFDTSGRRSILQSLVAQFRKILGAEKTIQQCQQQKTRDAIKGFHYFPIGKGLKKAAHLLRTNDTRRFVVSSPHVVNLFVVEPVDALLSPKDWFLVGKLLQRENDAFTSYLRRGNVLNDIVGPGINSSDKTKHDLGIFLTSPEER